MKTKRWAATVETSAVDIDSASVQLADGRC